MAIIENAGLVNVLLIVPENGTHANIRDILQSSGFENVKARNTLHQIESHLSIPVPDMIICSAEFPNGDSCELIKSLRLNDIGENPFTPVITVTAKPSKGFIQKIVSSGTDAVVIVPFSTQQLMSRIYNLIENRKQFVATSDYVGPDRRPASRAESDVNITKFNVPNPLRTKITGEEETVRIGSVIRTLMREITICRLDRQSDQIIYLSEQITEAYHSGNAGQSAAMLLVNLQAVAQDVITRMTGTPYEHVSGLCENLLQVTNDLAGSQDEAQEKNIKLLSQLSLAVQLGFASTDSAGAAHEIFDTLDHG